MIFLSGFAGLIYQVLWMRQLGLLFGNTAHAAAMTLAVFFAGLAAGNWFWGRRVSKSPNPLRLYAFLETGIAASALLYFWVISVFRLIYPQIYQATNSAWGHGLFKCLLAFALIFPPAFFMGGTIPAMGQYLIAKRSVFGTIVARIYGMNTIGAALGAFAAAFVAVPILGFNKTCFCAMAITGCVAILAYWLSLSWRAPANFSPPSPPPAPVESSGNNKPGAKDKKNTSATNQLKEPGIGRSTIFSLAFLSGFSVLALEVLWTRMFAQVHENSVYSFAAILVIVLICLSLGALLAALLAGGNVRERPGLAVLLLVGGGIVGGSPLLFFKLTDNLTMIPTDGTFAQYLGSLFLLGFATVGPACLLMGTIFPFLMKSEQSFTRHTGRSIGYISAINTIGAIAGSVICGFVLLRFVGMWETMQMIAVIYIGTGLLLTSKIHAGRWRLYAVGGVALLLIFTVLDPSNLKVIGPDPMRGKQEVLQVWESSDCTVSVAKDSDGHTMIKINSNYVLGSTGAMESQIFQAQLPLFVYPETKSLFFLGMGTGVTAGGALDKSLFGSLRHIVVCEMAPEVVEASELYMAGARGDKDYTNGLFDDPRVHIVIEDGRHYLMATKESFDMINADLFLPYRSGAGSLYSREHFAEAKGRLNPGGIFVQWLPLYQLTDFEFGTICHTMLSVFDQVTLWRNNFQPGGEVVALVGQKGKVPLPPAAPRTDTLIQAAIFGKSWRNPPQRTLPRDASSITLFYCGNLTASKDVFNAYPINTDDKPVIEYRSPLSLRQKTGTQLPPTFIGPKLADFVDQLLKNCPPGKDPVLANRTPENCRLPLAGAALHRAWVELALEHPEKSKEAWDRFVREWMNK